QAPYPTRQEIDEGALAGKGLELLYLADPVDVFFMQVQGSGRIELPDGSMVRVTYDGKNGHPYTSVGRHLIDTGAFAAEQVSLQSLEKWLKSEPARGRTAMWHNKSYVFFRELSGSQAAGPLGAMSIPLTEGRSLAVDTGFHQLGLPVWVSSPKLTHATRAGGFHRLMIAQDVGSAIRGAERGDIYFGSGEAAGRLAGVTKHPANFVVLLPKPRPSLVPDDQTAIRRPPNAPRSARQ
ncbi:MAG: MltA domain-containing protein, partial [Hyphomicrobium sp.]